ncbi:MAG: nuclear transport factor 2 family protein [Candidatus Nitrohelix vancouverensis]|uniref:Nuclear transport factor 2 family protein n=1 Tax=Candidatus Nitrohelix vancouverensis TaxID=2705534 RepID=A0A7T0C2B4_9BACT|nr:MAG: nuclear transport factor 2 family protein [Candidatus Nitrohelix vancouverensis]
MRVDPTIEKEIKVILDRLLALYVKADPDALLDIFSDEPDVTIIGTKTDSKYIGLENIKSRFKQIFDLTENISEFNYENLMVSGAESIAWISADINIKISAPDGTIKVFARLTAVFQRLDSEWKISQLHYSMPATFVE